jgi:hypothetical protein
MNIFLKEEEKEKEKEKCEVIIDGVRTSGSAGNSNFSYEELL